MDANSSFGLFGDSAATMLSLLIFLAAGTLAFALMIGVRAREAVRRRAARVGLDEDCSAGRRSLRYSGLRAAQKIVDYTAKHYSSLDGKDMKMLRHRLVQAGIYDSYAAAYFFIARTAMAIGLALGSFFVLQMLGMYGKIPFWFFVLAGGLCGYLTPSLYLDRRVARNASSIRPAFLTSWISWSCAQTLDSPWRPRSTGSGANSAIPIPRLPPTSTWPILKSAPVARSQRRLSTSATASASKRHAPSPP